MRTWFSSREPDAGADLGGHAAVEEQRRDRPFVGAGLADVPDRGHRGRVGERLPGRGAGDQPGHRHRVAADVEDAAAGQVVGEDPALRPERRRRTRTWPGSGGRCRARRRGPAGRSAWSAAGSGTCTPPSGRRRCATAASIIASAQALLIASGFSHSTCLPASAVLIAHSTCIGCGVAMYTASTVSVGEQVVVRAVPVGDVPLVGEGVGRVDRPAADGDDLAGRRRRHLAGEPGRDVPGADDSPAEFGVSAQRVSRSSCR